jgi:hypothetical protein
MYTMDYKGRDNINNWLLRSFSIFGFACISSVLNICEEVTRQTS